MLKRLTLLFMALCLLLSLAACGKPAGQKVSRPENWDVEAEVLRYCNGYFRAKTAEELKPYVTSETADECITEVMDQLNASMSGLAGTLDYRDYSYDSVEVTYLDAYEGFEILWVKIASSAFEAVAEELRKNTHGMVSYSNIGPGLLLVLAIENGHYVSSLDEGLSNEVLKKYDSCQSCRGQGGVTYLGFVCHNCNGAGTLTAYLCHDCYEVNIGAEILQAEYDPIEGIWKDSWTGLPCEYPALPLDPTGSQCCECNSSNLTTTQVSCLICAGLGGQKTTFEACTTCNGNGWIKK